MFRVRAIIIGTSFFKQSPLAQPKYSKSDINICNTREHFRGCQWTLNNCDWRNFGSICVQGCYALSLPEGNATQFDS